MAEGCRALVPTGRRVPTARDTKDKGTLLNAGRLMSRRVDREVEALKITGASLEDELVAAREQASAETIRQALGRTDGGLVVKALQKEVNELRAKVAALEGGTQVGVNRPSSSLAPSSFHHDDDLEACRIECLSLRSQVSELQRRLLRVQTPQRELASGSGMFSASEREELLEELEIARYEVELLTVDKNKVTSQLDLERVQRKLASEKHEGETKRLKSSLSTAEDRTRTRDAELSRLRAATDARSPAGLAAQLKANNEEWDGVLKKERAAAESTLAGVQHKHRECERRWSTQNASLRGQLEALQEEFAEAEERFARNNEEMELKRRNWIPRLNELAAAKKRVEAQSKELKRLNERAAVHQAEQDALKKRMVADRKALAKANEELSAARGEGGGAKADGEANGDVGTGRADAEVDARRLVQLEQEVVKLKVEKALAVDDAQSRIAALELALARAGVDVSTISCAEESPEDASSAVLADVVRRVGGYERDVHKVVDGLAGLVGDASSLRHCVESHSSSSTTSRQGDVSPPRCATM